MNKYERKILNALLDKYERSLLSRGENKVNIHIAFDFTRKTIPEYFDEATTSYEDIHASLYDMRDRGFISIIWRDNREGHIVRKVVLDTAHIDDIYTFLCRVPKADCEKMILALLAELQRKLQGPPFENRASVAVKFTEWLRNRIEAGETVKEFIDLSRPQDAALLIRCVAYVECNDEPHYYREFSVFRFGDSKAFERMKGTVRKIFIRFGGVPEETDEKELFAEYGIYDTPDYVYLKGDARLSMAGQEIDLSILGQGIGISGEDLENIEVAVGDNVNRVITIENLTTFFRWREPDSLIIYLGGYHNRSRRRMLGLVYKAAPDARYLHFGDIDAGGFSIYEDLCRKTGLKFETYHMGTAELEKYYDYCRPLTENDKRRLVKMLEDAGDGCPYKETAAFMLEHDVKLEQEIVICPSGRA